MKYEKQSCVHCGREFAKNDDVVVCPVCGTPHHRECWADGNGCGNAHRHEEGFVYKNPNAQSQTSEKTEKCNFCGTENPENSLVCHKCGAYFVNGAQRTQNGEAGEGAPFMGFQFTPPKNPYADSKEMIDDVPVAEVAKRVVVRTNYYIPRFQRLSKKKLPISWNWFSFLLPSCVWFYYRKCYLAGTLAAIFDMLLQVFFNGFLTAFTVLQNQFYENMDVVGFMKAFEELIFTPRGAAFFGLTIGFRVLMGLFGNSIYKTQVIHDIRAKKMSVGGTSFLLPIIGFFLFNSLTGIVLSLIG